MKNLSQLAGIASRHIKANSSIISSVAAGVGTVTTAILAARASFKAAEVIREQAPSNEFESDRERRWAQTKLVWRLYIPAGISGVSTILCIAGAHRFASQKTLAAHAALAVTERAYGEYRDKVVEEFGKRKDTAIRDKVVADQIALNPPPGRDILADGPGLVLCCESFTGRYFLSDMEKLRKAQNDLNAQLLKHDYATFNDWYYLIGLKQTSVSDSLGWFSNRQLSLEFSTHLTGDGRPCITFEYNYYMPL
jgi:Family of unknown function (DUF6353)